MSQKGFFVGIGAAGNKAVAELIERGICTKDDALLLNSTLDDVPERFKEISKKLEGSIGGCGKERTLAKTLTLNALRNGHLDLRSTVDNSYSLVTVIASTEGGTGSGACPLIAKYYSDVVKIHTHVIAFKGFSEDSRGLQNTIEFFQDLNDLMTVQIIDNTKFMEECNGNKFKAEKAANEELCKRVNILLGLPLINSEQNIDMMDIYKVTNTPGFSTIEYRELDNKIKNVKEFNTILDEILDESKTVDAIIPSQKRLAAIINLPEKERDAVDFRFSVVRERLGDNVFEYFSHVQYDGKKPFIAFISSGMKMPIDEIKKVHAKYKEASSALDKAEDQFYKETRELKGNIEDCIFDTALPDLNSGNEDNFFKEFIPKVDKKK